MQDKIDCAGRFARDPWGRLDDFTSGETTVFPYFDSQIVARQADEVVDAIHPALPTRAAGGSGGAAAGVVRYRRPSGTHEQRCTHRGGTASAAGQTGGTALSASFSGDTQAFYVDLARAQAGRYSAYVDIDDHVIASASPDLFFEWTGTTLRTRPMKDMTGRGRTSTEDRSVVAWLRTSPKERAENLIVVDLLRNDLGKVATMGSVRVPALFTPERYPTVWQLTSEITAELRPEIGLVEIFDALFPSGSVTARPKLKTMSLIRETEQRDRGIYCGAIGWVAPVAEETRARFSVAICTAHTDRSSALRIRSRRRHHLEQRCGGRVRRDPGEATTPGSLPGRARRGGCRPGLSGRARPR